MYLRTLMILASSLTLTSCATMKSNTFIGASIGATSGAVGGAMIGSPNNSVSGAMIGAGTGALVGGLIGWLTEPKTTKQVPTLVTNKDGSDPDAPGMIPVEYQRVWVPDKIEEGGKKFVKGHFIYVIERGSVWSMP